MDDEADRLRVLHAYDILDSVPEPAFDDVVQLASEICETPIALVSLVDTSRQWFKAALGVDFAETSRSVSFCAHAIRETETFIVEDATKDDRFAENGLVVGDTHLRFYAGTQLRTRTGHALGTLCVLDRVPRRLRPQQLQALRVLGRQVEAQLELRKVIRDLATREAKLGALRAQTDQLRAFLVHDLKNVLGMILPNAEFLCEAEHLTDEERGAATDLRESAKRMQQMVITQLRAPPRISPQLEEVDLVSLVNDVARLAQRRTEEQGRVLTVTAPANACSIRADGDLLRRMVENLVDNSLTHAGPTATKLSLTITSTDDGAVIVVSDDGAGLTGERAASVPKAHGHGLGLPFCRNVVEAHGGTLTVTEASPHGAAFSVELPRR